MIEQSVVNPSTIAVEYRNEMITYEELHQRSNRLANYLVSCGVRKETIVPVFFGHSIDIIVSIVAILKTGAAYLPIDPEFPVGRIAYILEDVAPNLIITNSICAYKLPECFNKLILDHQWPLIRLQTTTPPIHHPVKPDLAYVIYTSGSTGRPKGVAVEHSQIFNYTVAASDKLGLKLCERIGLVGTFSSDACLMALFGSLCYGKRLFLIDIKNMHGFSDIAVYFETRCLDCYKTTPSLMASFLQQKDVKRMLPTKRLLLGGEDCPPSIIAQLNSLLQPTCDLINHYGPTETTVAVLTYEFPREEFKGNVLLGDPLGDTEAHILNTDNLPLPIGTVGELYISGSFVTRGYLNNPELTAERFIYQLIAGEEKRLYRTGDYVVLESDGNIRNCGRIDDQIKINGYRIELKEIEHQILESGMVRHCLVMSKLGRLTAFVSPGETFDQAALSSKLQTTLPLYMIPKKIILVHEWPRTINNKVDRKLLFDLDEGDCKLNEMPVRPASDLIGKLRNIWAEELGITDVDENADFFELGGDSLQLIKLSFAIEDQVGVAIGPYELFGCLTLEKQASIISSKLNNPYQHLLADGYEDNEASSAQINLFIQHKLNPKESFPNVSLTLEIIGELDIDHLNECFLKLISNNESLRTSFFFKQGRLYQQINNHFQFALTLHAAASNHIDKELLALTLPFQFDEPPLIRAFIIDFPNSKRFLYIDMPHINSDGESIKVIMNELEALYNNNYEYHDKKQFRHFQRTISQYLQSNFFKEDERYWSNQFVNETYRLNFPSRKLAFGSSRFTGVQVVTELPSHLMGELKKFVKENYITRFQLLYAAYLLTLYERFGNEEFLVMIPVHNRQARAFQNVVGLLTNVIVQKARIYPGISLLQFTKILRDNMLEALRYQRYPFESLTRIWKEKGYDFKNLFNLFFGYHYHREQYRFGNAKLDLHIPSGNRENLPLSVAIFETETRMFVKLSSNNAFTKSELDEIVQSFFDVSFRLVTHRDNILK